jgi:S1-C subfamily serine protease
LSDGIISGTHKTIYLIYIDKDALPYGVVDAMVSTVITNPGSVGAPLFNMKGQIIGMNTGLLSVQRLCWIKWMILQIISMINP